MAIPSLPDLALVAAIALLACLHGLTLSGHFPAEHRRASLGGPLGAATLWGTTVAVGIAFAIGIRLGWQRLALPVLVLAIGAAALFTPLILRPLPDSFVDGRRGLLASALLALVLAALAWPRLA